VLFSNSGVGQRLYPTIAKLVLGDLGTPWAWEYSRQLPIAP